MGGVPLQNGPQKGAHRAGIWAAPLIVGLLAVCVSGAPITARRQLSPAAELSPAAASTGLSVAHSAADPGGPAKSATTIALAEKAPAPPPENFSVVVPDKVQPGQDLIVTAPDGRTMKVTVPEGAVPGGTLEVALPPQPPPPPPPPVAVSATPAVASPATGSGVAPAPTFEEEELHPEGHTTTPAAVCVGPHHLS